MNNYAVRALATEHATRLAFLFACVALKYDGQQTKTLIEQLTEKIRREPFPTNDPALSMYSADELADAFSDILELPPRLLAVLDQAAKAQVTEEDP